MNSRSIQGKSQQRNSPLLKAEEQCPLNTEVRFITSKSSHKTHSYFTLGNFTACPGTHTHTHIYTYGWMKLQQQASAQPSLHFKLSRPDYFWLLFFFILHNYARNHIRNWKGRKKILQVKRYSSLVKIQSYHRLRSCSCSQHNRSLEDSLSHYASGPSHLAATAHAELQPGRHKDQKSA